MSALKKRFRAGRTAGVYSLLLLAFRDLKAEDLRVAGFLRVFLLDPCSTGSGLASENSQII
jgi:hypothetical protein